MALAFLSELLATFVDKTYQSFSFRVLFIHDASLGFLHDT